MHLVQLLLPLYDNAGQALPQRLFAEVRDELVQHFGGVTAYLRAPATGLWKDEQGGPVRDDLVILEVMVETLDVAWWGHYRTRLEERFKQQAVVVRTQAIALL